MYVQERLIEEREQLGLNQDQMAMAGGVKKRAYCYYESGERTPDASFLAGVAKFGADVRYIITGERDGPAPEVLTSDERLMLDRYRASPKPLRDAALRVLLGESPAEPKARKKTVINGNVGQPLGNVNGTATFNVNMGDKKK
jgi:transcriptional regulator with XRE-family HTH domain